MVETHDKVRQALYLIKFIRWRRLFEFKLQTQIKFKWGWADRQVEYLIGCSHKSNLKIRLLQPIQKTREQYNL